MNPPSDKENKLFPENSNIIKNVNVNYLKVLKCTFCDHKTDNKYSLIIHERTHTGEKPFACEKCDFRFISSYSLNYHKKTHAEGRPYTCGICDSRFKHLSTFTTHIKRHQGIYRCPICQKDLCGNNYLRAHMNKHRNEDGKVYKCKLCEEEFQDSVLYFHHRRTHSINKTIECNLCGDIFTKLNLYEAHRRHHRRSLDKISVGCDQCSKKFANDELLQKHKKYHSVERPHKCQICEYRVLKKSQLNDHMKVHTDHRPYSCHICESRYKRKQDLIVHSIIHQGTNIPILKKERKALSAKGEQRHSLTEADAADSLTESQSEAVSESFEVIQQDHHELHSSVTVNTELNDETLQNMRNMQEISNKVPAGPETSLPLSVLLYKTVISSEDTIILVWLKKMESDVIFIAHRSSAKIAVCYQEKCNIADKYKFSTEVTFSVKSSNSTAARWHMYSFNCSERVNKLKDKQFESYREVESTVCECSQTMDLVNVVRRSKKGVMPRLVQQLQFKTVFCNSDEQTI